MSDFVSTEALSVLDDASIRALEIITRHATMHVNSVTTRWLEDQLAKSLPRNEAAMQATKVARLFDEQGLARYVVGRRGNPSRILFMIDPKTFLYEGKRIVSPPDGEMLDLEETATSEPQNYAELLRDFKESLAALLDVHSDKIKVSVTIE